MRDNQEVMLMFVKIVERYPQIYDSSKDMYRIRHAQDNAWEQVATAVRNEIKEECTADELKAKWKGIRSSFSRYKNKLYLYQSGFETTPCKTYYLYESLRYLDPFTKPKGIPPNSGNGSGATFNDIDNGYYVDVDDNASIEYTPNIEEWEDHDIKPDISQTVIKDSIEVESSESEKEISKNNTIKKRKYVDQDKDSCDTKIENNEDVQFFRSILPDIKNFTSKEKRKFKMGILQLIDEIEDDRKRCKSSNEVSSS